ncbi:2-methoxy-6-polyprenyl-1,4-benzoquinol methylase, mitochondrial-like [Biomphalaria glabrata]|uniref:2-methoxy-6-polyprenyl-1,4-benzoquinol methylase, mitochondrial n=1 Tax=Biomphalaria glabrata TaxID=6526 RepID=A0A9W2YJD8_BIOGL|nr:2-methoxy-6-polyprenyl-1,4-benzoquinol methylase, mitochondrial-like [Biomphalaria glabrata]KAI8783256.1 2-methoxy-6-polyprenyl-1,4-benzoquinol methylase, mitochondrial isoform X1 [Biomphalaria glabrata]
MAASFGKQSLFRLSRFSCRCKTSGFLNTKLFASPLVTSGCRHSSSSAHTNSNKQESEKHETHFGFQSVSEEEKENKVYEVFENVATKYDLMNDAMSAGVHRLWKDMFLERFSPTPGTKLLDVAGGTGDIAFRFLKYVGTPVGSTFSSSASVAQSSSDDSSSSDSEGTQVENKDSFSEPDINGSHVTVCDINQAMLDVGKAKAKSMGYSSGISWVKGNAEVLPLPDNTFDAYTIAFGIRNCTHVQKVIDEAYRVLKPGGRFMCLEFSEVKNPLLRSVYDSYSFQVIPVMGQVIAGDWKSYQYLVESIRQFPNQETFAAMIKSAGFRFVNYKNLTFGVAAIHSGFKI